MIGDSSFRRDVGEGGQPDRGRLDDICDQWLEYAELDERSPLDAEGVRHLLSAAEAQDGQDPVAEGIIEEIAGNGDPDRCWGDLGELHLALDRAVDAGAITVEDASLLRIYLNRLTGRIHRAAIDGKLRLQSELLRDITHDLRVPLQSIVFMTDSLYDERHGDLNETQRRQLGGVYSASATLLNLVNDLLDLSRSTQENLESVCVPFSIAGVVEDVKHLVRPVADHHRANLEIDVRSEDSWYGDPQLVRRLLLNLVTNALEASGEEGRVTVTVEGPESWEADPGMSRLTIADGGPGVDVDRAEALLSPGTVSDWKQKLDGTDGLGLLITGRLVRAAGGSISVERRESGGTRFTVLLPYGGRSEEVDDRSLG